MSKEWTKEQLEAIGAFGKGAIVSAAAGSGKTAVLIERTIRLLSDESKRISADSLLAVTFTNAAASQLRDKLTSALAQKIAENPENEWLGMQQSKLQAAKIMTINAFCLDIVRNNVHTLGLQNGLRILEENDVAVIDDEMFEKAIDDFFGTRSDDMNKLMNFMFGKKTSLKETAKDMYKYLRSVPFSDEYMKASLDKLCSEASVREYCNCLTERYIPDCKRAVQLIENAKIIAGRMDFESVSQTLCDDCEFFSSLQNGLETHNWDLCSTLLLNHKHGKNKASISKKEEKTYSNSAQLENDKVSLKTICGMRDACKKILVDMRAVFACDFDEVCKDCKLSAELIKILYDLTEYAGELISKEKAIRNGCDFADVELMTVKLLAQSCEGVIKRTELCKEMRASGEYGIILIDEFQDTNDLQELIFKCISDTDDLEILGKNVFVVGDIKQAIYGFRNSNPKLFMKARKNARKEQYKDELSEIILSKNFRSRTDVIDFTNFLFSHLMSAKTGEVDYTESERLNFGAPYDSTPSPTELVVYSGDDEHYAVAKKIRDMIDSGVQVFENGAYRPCCPSDFCILSRTKKRNAVYAAAFEKYGLKISCREIDGYLKSREVSLMISLLKVIDNPMNDIAMLSVMLSPLLMFTDDEAARLKACAKYGSSRKLYQIMLAAEKDELDAGESVKQKCVSAIEKIRRYRYYASAMPIEQLIRKLYIETDFYIFTSAFSGGERAQANLRLLLELAADYNTSGGGGLTGFVRYFDSVAQCGKDFKQAVTVTEENNSVNVMTMHKSKGLEFPFVLLCGLDNGFNFDSSDILVFDESGIGAKITDRKNCARYSTVAYSAIAQRKRSAVISEEIRLLYVAVTRAKEKLILFIPQGDEASYKNASELISSSATHGCITPETASKAKSMLDWVLTACAFHKDCAPLIKSLCLPDCVVPQDSICKIEVSHTEGKLDERYLSTAAIKSTSTDTMLVKKLEEMLKTPPVKPSEELAKVSVTEISHPNAKPAPFYPQIPDLSKTESRFSSAMRGTLTHRFMELCDFDKASVDVMAELKRLVNSGKFSAFEADGIYTDALKKFFAGEFAQRMRASQGIIREQQFMVRLSDLGLDNELFGQFATSDGMIQGIADCLFEEQDGYVLVDYKTDKVTELSQLADEYSLQLKLYKQAFNLILDKPIKSCVIYSLYLGDGISIDV